jgi:hypothetical protein
MRSLTPQEKRLRILPLSAEFERSEILVPGAVWNVRGMPAPLFQGKKIFQRNLPFFGPVKEVLTQLRG